MRKFRSSDLAVRLITFSALHNGILTGVQCFYARFGTTLLYCRVGAPAACEQEHLASPQGYRIIFNVGVLIWDKEEEL